MHFFWFSMGNLYFKFLKLFLFGRYKFLTGITITLSLLSAVFSGLGFGLYIPVINSFLEESATPSVFVSMSNFVLDLLGLQPSLLVLIVIATSVIFLGALITYGTMLVSGYLCCAIIWRVKNRLIGDVLGRPYSWFHNVKTGKVVSILNEQASKASGNLNNFFKLLTYVLLSVGYLIALFIISTNLTFVMVFFGGALLYSNLYFSRKIYLFATELRNVMLNLAFSFTESIIGIKTIKSMGLEKYRCYQTKPLLDEERFVSFKIIFGIIFNLFIIIFSP